MQFGENVIVGILFIILILQDVGLYFTERRHNELQAAIDACVEPDFSTRGKDLANTYSKLEGRVLPDFALDPAKFFHRDPKREGIEKR